MKKLLLTLSLAFGAAVTFGQVIFSVEEPASIQGLKSFTSNGDGSSWGLTTLVGQPVVIDTIAIMNDGSTGLNAQGLPVSLEGCDSLGVNDLTGKIALIYRNTCGFGQKALYAQAHGAVAVIIVNREEALINMNGGTEGASVTIPVVFIQKSDGDAIRTTIEGGTTVVGLIGDKTGLFANDISIYDNRAIRADYGSKPLPIAQNANEFAVPFGGWVYNYGQNPQENVRMTTTVKKNGATLYTQTSAGASINANDSLYITTPTFSQASYTAGEYEVMYSINMDSTDLYDADNVSSYKFSLGDLWSLAHLDTATTVHVDGYYRANTLPSSTFETCVALKDANAGRIATNGAYFGGLAVAVADTATLSLVGQAVDLTIYEWNDADVTTASTAISNINAVATGTYEYLTNASEQTIFIPLMDPPVFTFQNNQQYLACITTYEPRLYIGYSTKDYYDENILADDLIRFPHRPDGGAFVMNGFGITSSLAFNTSDDLAVAENNVEAAAFPNPSTDVITVKLNATGNATLSITDIAGRLISTQTIKVNNGQFTTNVAGMNNGTYVFALDFENGAKSRFNVVVTK
ncbi:MAG: T9SS type A sorting domain-containing protein [Fluviicola sp.]|nr:T9SS type A sorting domain-containing protein [Fluviicola sp.]